MRCLCWLVSLLIMCVIGPAWAATRYVQATCTGCDSNSCTAAQNINTPRQSINAGLACTAGGDTLIVRGGTGGNCLVYTERNLTLPSGSPGAYTTLTVPGQGHLKGGECATIRPLNQSDTDIFRIDNRHHILVEGFKLDGSDGTGDMRSHARRIASFALRGQNTGNSDIIFRYNEMLRTHHSCLIVEGTRWEFRENLLHHCGYFCCNSGDPANTAQHTDQETGFTSSGDSHGMYFEANNSLITGNTFHHNPAWHIQIYGDTPLPKDNNIVENNRFSTARCGMLTMQGTGHIVRNNLEYDDGHNEDLDFPPNSQFNGSGCPSSGNAPTTTAGIEIQRDNQSVINNTLYGHRIYEIGGSGGQIRNNIVCNGGSISAGGNTAANNLTGTCPAFQGAGSGNFHLVSDDPSLAPRQASALLDFDGVSRRSNTARGAYEFVSGPPPPPVTQAGPLIVHPANARYFQEFNTGKALLLTGSHSWCSFTNYNVVDAGPDVCTLDYPTFLSFLAARHHNFTKFWLWQELGAEIIPYLRTGPGTALDGQPKVNLQSVNQAFFDRLRARVIAARDQGVYVAIMLFATANYYDTWWNFDWYNAANNTQGIDGQSGGNCATPLNLSNCPLFDFPGQSAVLAVQEALIRKVIDTVNDLDNVLYEIGNELPHRSLPWQQHMVTDIIRAYEGTGANLKRHPVGITPTNDTDMSELLGTVADWISPGGSAGTANAYAFDPPVATGQKVILTDTDHIGNSQADTPFALWANVTRGNHFMIMENENGPAFVTNPTYDPVRYNAGQALTYLATLPLASMVPHGELSSTQYALAAPGQAYLAFQPGSGQFTLQMQAGTYSVTWWNVNARTEQTPSDLTVATGSQPMTPPFSGPAVLVLQSTTTPPPAANSLIAHWKLDEGTNTTAADFTGNGHTGTLGGSPVPSWTTGKVGPFALTFNGSNYFDMVGSFTETSYSWALWVQGTQAPDTSDQIVFANGIQADNIWGFGWSSSAARFQKAASHRDGTGAYITAQIPDALQAGVWYHIAATYDGVNLKIYLNGTLKATSPVTSVLSPSGNFRVGNDKSGAFGFQGALDDIRIYNFPLTQQQIADLAGTPPPVATVKPRHVVVVQ